MNTTKKKNKFLNNRQVASLVTFKVSMRKEFEPIKVTDFFNALSTDSNPELIRRFVSFHYDRCISDENIIQKMTNVLENKKDILSFYETLNQSPTPEEIKKIKEQGAEYEIKNYLAKELPELIIVDFNIAAMNREKAIKEQVPFLKLQKNLLRLNRGLDHSARGYIEDISIIQAPKYQKEINPDHLNEVFLKYKKGDNSWKSLFSRTP
jgi:hypothetical protein